MFVKHSLPFVSDGQRLPIALRRSQHAHSGVRQSPLCSISSRGCTALTARTLTGSQFPEGSAFLPSKQTHNRICFRSAHQQEPNIFLSVQSHFCCSALLFSHIIILTTTFLGSLSLLGLMCRSTSSLAHFCPCIRFQWHALF